MTSKERAVLDALADVWGLFLALREGHPLERHEFMHAIHDAQRIVMCRACRDGERKGAGGAGGTP